MQVSGKVADRSDTQAALERNGATSCTTMNTPSDNNDRSYFEQITADRWWIAEYVQANRERFVAKARRKFPALSDDVIGDHVDAVSYKVAAPHSDDWLTGFPVERFANREAGLETWATNAIERSLLNETTNAGSRRRVDISGGDFEALVGVTDDEAAHEIRAMLESLDELPRQAKVYAIGSALGFKRRDFRAQGMSVRQQVNARAAIAELRGRVAALSPVAALLGLLRRGGGEAGGTAVAGGTGATVAATGFGAKVIAGCAAGVVCVGGVAGGVIVSSHDAPAAPGAKRAAAADSPKRLYTPIDQSSFKKTSPSTSVPQKKKKRRGADSTSDRQTSQEFGVERSAPPASSPPPASPDGGSSEWGGEFTP